MKSLFRKVTALLLLTAVVSPLMASGQKEEAADGKKKKRELTAMILQSRNFTGLQEMIAKLEEEENIIIDAQVVPDDQYDNLLRMKVSSGEAPDIMDYNVPHIYSVLDAEKYLVDMSDQPWASDLVNPKMSQYNGKTYAYTFMATAGFQAMVYNKDIFDKHGLKEPKTEAEFYALCDALKSKGEQPIVLASDIWVPQIWMTAGFSRALGSKEACEDFADKILTNKATFSDYPQLNAVLDNYLGMFKKGYINKDFLTLNIDGAYERVGTGKAAMLFGSSGLAANIASAFPDANLGIFNMPVDYDKGDHLSATLFSYGFVASKDSENLDTVKEVFNLWSTPEYGDMYFANRPGFPALPQIDGGQLPDYTKNIYDNYVVKGKSIAEMNIFLNKLVPVMKSTMWIYYQEAPSKNNMTSADMLVKFQDATNKYMTEMKAPGFAD